MMRLRKDPNIEETLKKYEDYLLPGGPVDFGEVFGNDRRVRAEFGVGKGQFILQIARENPDINFIGVEIRDQVLLKALKKLGDARIPNLRFMVMDVAQITEIFQPKSIDGLYLNFSDPWPKTRHHKRRLTHRDFIEKYDRILSDEAWIYFKTDHSDFFHFTLRELIALQLPVRDISFDVHSDARFTNNIVTEYEEKFSKKGHRIMAATFKTRL